MNAPYRRLQRLVLQEQFAFSNMRPFDRLGFSGGFVEASKCAIEFLISLKALQVHAAVSPLALYLKPRKSLGSNDTVGGGRNSCSTLHKLFWNKGLRQTDTRYTNLCAKSYFHSSRNCKALKCRSSPCRRHVNASKCL